MCDVEAEVPESITETATPPTCTVEMKEEDCHDKKTDADQRRVKINQKAKWKLQRSAAVCDDAPLTESGSKESEGESSLTANTSECEEEQEEKCKDNNTKKPSLSKESSLEYTDSTGIDLEEFLITTLKSSPRDRLMLLKLEQDMTDFMTDNCSYKKFPQMSSYHRMLVHRVAAYFGLEHNVDHSGKAVIINKASNSRIPEQRFSEHVQEERSEEKRSILKRDNSQEKDDGQKLSRLKEQMKSKSFEEREEEYQKVRERIFSQDSACPAQSVYIETRGPEDFCNLHSETQRRRQLFRGTRDGSGRWSGSRQSSFELECQWNDPRPWSSTDSDSSTWSSKLTQSHSDSNPKLCKPVTEAAAGNSSAYVLVPAESSILPGTILLNPNTGQPYLNPDGTPAVYNPPTCQQPPSNHLNTNQPQVPPPPQPQQQAVMNHPLPQVQYSSVPQYLSPQQVLTVSPSQYQPPDQTRDDLSSQFSHMTLSHQSLGESDMSTYYLHGAPPAQGYTHPQQNYAPPFPAESYVNSGVTLTMPAAAPSQTCSQQSNQASMYSYPGQCGNTSQQYGPASYSTQTGYTTLLTSQQQAYSNMVGAPVLQQTQNGVIGSYPSTSSYQMPPPVQSYPSTVLVSRHAGQNQNTGPSAGVSVYCNPLNHSPPPAPPHSVGITCQSGGCRNTCNRTQNQCWY